MTKKQARVQPENLHSNRRPRSGICGGNQFGASLMAAGGFAQRDRLKSIYCSGRASRFPWESRLANGVPARFFAFHQAETWHTTRFRRPRESSPLRNPHSRSEFSDWCDSNSNAFSLNRTDRPRQVRTSPIRKGRGAGKRAACRETSDLGGQPAQFQALPFWRGPPLLL